MASSFIQRRIRRTHFSMAMAVNLVIITGATAQQSESEEYQITVRSLEFGNPELVTYDLDGRNPRRFGPEGVDGHDSAWSPDGKRLVFSHADQIVVLDLDTMHQIVLTSGPGYKHVPAWSPDGQQIAYLSSSEKEKHWRHRISIIPSKMWNAPTMVHGWELENAFDPAWSPDGNTLVVKASGMFHFLDAQTQHPVLPNVSLPHAWRPAWSPDGRMIAFHMNSHIFVSPVNDVGVRQLTHTVGYHDSPAWSPDGRYIAYRHSSENLFSDEAPPGDLVVLDVVTETHRTLLRSKLPRQGSRPSWRLFTAMEGN